MSEETVSLPYIVANVEGKCRRNAEDEMNKALTAVDDVISAIHEVTGKLLNKIVFLSLILILLCLMVALISGIINQNRVWGLSAAAQRLGFANSYEGLADYISQTLDPGMSREQVEQALLNIGRVEIVTQGPLEDDHEYNPRGEVTSYDRISLVIPDRVPILGEVSGVTFPMYAYYDQQGRLVDLHYAGEPRRTDYPEPDYVDPPVLDIYATSE